MADILHHIKAKLFPNEVTQFNGSTTLLKEPRTARLNRTLTVD
jgi:hypothetical protein